MPALWQNLHRPSGSFTKRQLHANLPRMRYQRAFEAIGISKENQDEILEIIHEKLGENQF